MSHLHFPSATREYGLKRLDAFILNMGLHYASKRNSDFGPDVRDNVSMISPYIRHRLITEDEAVKRALDSHGAHASEKYIQEVIWRSYWKGWLEHRSTVWDDYLYDVDEQHEKLNRSGELRKDYDKSIQGQTGIECFDFWAKELVETNYLHNHARMWFASIWIFTLGLPWALGAEFFYKHLLDGDPASNTLSWRWVGGLHTVGKSYLARADNIQKFTNGRFNPSPNELAQQVELLEEPNLPERHPIKTLASVDWSKPTALLITSEDCLPETIDIPIDKLAAVATLPTQALRVTGGAAQAVIDFERNALTDVARRMPTKCSVLNTPDAIAGWATNSGAQQIVTSYLPVGTTRDALQPALNTFDIPHVQVRRKWDELIWPKATAGFFKVKKQIPNLLQSYFT